MSEEKFDSTPIGVRHHPLELQDLKPIAERAYASLKKDMEALSALSAPLPTFEEIEAALYRDLGRVLNAIEDEGYAVVPAELIARLEADRGALQARVDALLGDSVAVEEERRAFLAERAVFLKEKAALQEKYEAALEGRRQVHRAASRFAAEVEAKKAAEAEAKKAAEVEAKKALRIVKEGGRWLRVAGHSASCLNLLDGDWVVNGRYPVRTIEEGKAILIEPPVVIPYRASEYIAPILGEVWTDSERNYHEPLGRFEEALHEFDTTGRCERDDVRLWSKT